MGLIPDWLKAPMKLIEDFPVKETRVDSSKVPETFLFMLGYDKDHPAPETLPGYKMPGPGLKTIVLPFWF